MARASARLAVEAMQEELRAVVENAQVSREERRSAASRFRQWYDYGTENAIPAANNKLRSHLDRLASYLWASDTVRFGVYLPPSTRQPWLAAAAMARDEFRQVWTLSGADRTISMALESALVYGAVPLKVRYDAEHGFTLDAIDPWDFGVTREDQSELEDQDAYAHWYTLSYPQFERWVYGHPREAELTALARDRRRQPYGSGSTGPLVVSAITGSFPNSAVSTVNAGESPDAAWSQDAIVREPVLYLVDVWQRRLYHDPAGKPYEDWRVTTAFADDLSVLVRRRNPILPWLPSPSGDALDAEDPFTMLVPHPVANYFWGRSTLL